jgi:rhodanese-related sulfurtransferase
VAKLRGFAGFANPWLAGGARWWKLDRNLRQNSGEGLDLSDNPTIFADKAPIYANPTNANSRKHAMVEIVSREELKKGLSDGSITLLDVREPNEFAAGHIPGAQLFPLSRFDPAQLPKDPDKRIVFSCRSGGRTLQAIEMARLGGRKDACAHYAGSMNDWLANGEPVEK